LFEAGEQLVGTARFAEAKQPTSAACEVIPRAAQGATCPSASNEAVPPSRTLVGIEDVGSKNGILMTSKYGRLIMIKSSEVLGIKATPFFYCTRIHMILQHHAAHRSSSLYSSP
jgi:hypothetical protein